MSDLQTLLAEIDELSPDELEQIYRHVVRRRQRPYWLIPGENLKALREIMEPVHEQSTQMTDEEIDAVIDESLGEVRRARKTDSRH